MLAVLALASLAAACGDSGSTAAAPGRPKDPPPRLEGVPGSPPPPAWIETERGSRWLGFSSYCWRTACVDFIPPRCGDGRTPRILLRRGELVRFHLGFRPRELTLDFLEQDGARQLKLTPSRTATWRAVRGGVASLSARAGTGSASYVGCFRLR